jgi:A/G-specific adenine glycosylase
MIIAVSAAAAASEASNIFIGSVMAPITRSCRITTQQQPQSSCRSSASTTGKKASIGGKVCELGHGAEGDDILLPSFVGEKITTTRKQELVRVSRAVKVDRKQQHGEKKRLRAAKKRLKSRSHAADDDVDEEEEEEAENLALVSSADDIEDFWPLQQQQQQQLPSETFSFSAEEVVDIRSSLLSWYDRNHRVLPWRLNPHSLLQAPPIVVVDRTGVKQQEKNVQPKAATSTTTKPDNHQPIDVQEQRAYAVWVSEMMLQQTRVATVITYYQNWMEKWPSIFHLAQASQEEVNAVWAGLGYYRRARFLLEGAKQIVHNLGGRFPRTVVELQKVPGIGSYTAGAIASIAFKQAVPVVDGNVIRVLCRLRAIALNPKASTTVKLFWTLAKQLVDALRPGDFNQALMELGATICSPTSPSCASCPIASHCKALDLVGKIEKKISSVTLFPTKVVKAIPRNEYVTVCVVERSFNLDSSDASSSFLLVQRPQQGLLAGLWEFPSAPLKSPNASISMRMSEMDKYLEETLGLKIQRDSWVVNRQEIGCYTHVFSHIRLHMSIEWLLLHSSEDAVEGHGAHKVQSHNGLITKWVDGDSIHGLGLTSGVKKVHKMFSEFQEDQKISFQVSKSKRTKTPSFLVCDF